MLSKRLTIIIAVVAFLLSSGASYLYFAKGAQGVKELLPTGAVPNVDEAREGPKTEACPMNGQMMTKGQRKRWESRRPMGIMVENHLDARPQSGLSNADVIYEAVAEGGITRFLSIFYCDDAKVIGPVRSARIYFLKILQGYGQYPLYAHVGGANTPGPADALGEINDMGWGGYNDMNQFSVPFPIYYRDYERLPGRVTEHTMYSSTLKLWEYAAEKRDLTEKDKDGKMWNEDFKPWEFADEATAAKRGKAGSVSFGFWSNFGSTYDVKWNYTPEDNIYRRENGGNPHVDKNTNTALRAKNVIIVFADESPANDGYPGGHLLYDIVGRGEALLFQNGHVIKGSWKKPSEEEMMRFFDAGGNELSLVRGKTWVEILPTGNDVTY